MFSDEDWGPEEHQLGVSLHTLKPSARDTSLETIPDSFIDHTQRIYELLLSEKSTGRHDLTLYTLRSCFAKIASRAALFCRPIAKSLRGEKTTLKHPQLFRLLPCRQASLEILEKQVSTFSFLRESMQRNIKELQKAIRPQVPPLGPDWEAWAQKSLPTSAEFKEDVKQLTKKPFPRAVIDAITRRSSNSDEISRYQEGAYASPRARNNFHIVFTTVLWRVLFFASVLAEPSTMSCIRDDWDKPENGAGRVEEVRKVMELFLPSYRILEACTRPFPLESHLRIYFHATGRTGTSIRTECLFDSGINLSAGGDTTSDNEDYCGYEGIELPIQSLESTLSSWLALVCEHYWAIHKRLQIPKARLARMKIDLVCIRTEPESFQMTGLRETLLAYKQNNNTTDDILEQLIANTKDGPFRGTYHCEAVLGSLNLLARPGLDHPSVSANVVRAAKGLDLNKGAITERCYPVCFRLLSDPELVLGKVAYGRHAKFVPCSLPPWLPRAHFLRVMEKLEACVQEWYEERVQAIVSDRRSFTGSSAGRGSGDWDSNDYENDPITEAEEETFEAFGELENAE